MIVTHNDKVTALAEREITIQDGRMKAAGMLLSAGSAQTHVQEVALVHRRVCGARVGTIFIESLSGLGQRIGRTLLTVFVTAFGIAAIVAVAGFGAASAG